MTCFFIRSVITFGSRASSSHDSSPNWSIYLDALLSVIFAGFGGGLWGFQYEVGKTYEMSDSPICCTRGFHFCTKAADCFNYYSFNPENKVAEVVALGEVDSENDDTKCCTNKIQIANPYNTSQKVC